MLEVNIKDLQKVELEILLEFDRICKKYNIKYWLISGTLLGAIRHNGFIPWDDDIDICMPIKDYYRFCKIAKNELNASYFLQNYKTDITGMWFAKIRKNNTTAIENNHETKLHHQGVWIDIFPLIGVKDKERSLKSIQRNCRFAKTLLNKKIGLLENTENNILYKAVNFLIPIQLLRLMADCIFKFSLKSHDNTRYCYYLWASPTISARFDSGLFFESCQVEFEGYMFPAPKKWDEYLKVVYGDYMTPPPIDKRNGGCHTLQIVDLNNNYSKYLKRK